MPIRRLQNAPYVHANEFIDTMNTIMVAFVKGIYI